MKRIFWYAAMTKDEAQHSRMTFYKAVFIEHQPFMGNNISPEIEESALSDVKDEIKEPSMYRVLLHNDD